jgi:sugar phosphate isomerase/epimerase
MRSAVTVSLVPEARGAPFIFWDDLEQCCAAAAELGFDAIEIFPPDPETVALEKISPLLQRYGLRVAAVGTGGVWALHRWHFTHAEAAIRQRARAHAVRIVEAAAALGAPAIVGVIQGKYEGAVTHGEAVEWLREALEELGAVAARHSQIVLYEPLNRYETNLFNRIDESVAFLRTLETKAVRLLADMFHLNIEERSIADALRAGGEWIAHFHFADSNRLAIGWGHTPVEPIVAALRDIGYRGYISGEALPRPDSYATAAQTMRAFRQHFRP